MSETLIQSNPSGMMGKPVVAGTRVTVELILEKEVLDRANTDGSPLVTSDKDFGELVFRLHRRLPAPL